MGKYKSQKNAYELVLNDLGHQIVHDLSDNLLVTPPAIISSVVLMNRIGISDERLSEKVQWLCK